MAEAGYLERKEGPSKEALKKLLQYQDTPCQQFTEWTNQLTQDDHWGQEYDGEENGQHKAYD